MTYVTDYPARTGPDAPPLPKISPLRATLLHHGRGHNPKSHLQLGERSVDSESLLRCICVSETTVKKSIALI
jgi:hypothetical protein